MRFKAWSTRLDTAEGLPGVELASVTTPTPRWRKNRMSAVYPWTRAVVPDEIVEIAGVRRHPAGAVRLGRGAHERLAFPRRLGERHRQRAVKPRGVRLAQRAAADGSGLGVASRRVSVELRGDVARHVPHRRIQAARALGGPELRVLGGVSFALRIERVPRGEAAPATPS